MEHTIDHLKEVLIDNGFELQPYNQDEINKAINIYGQLPSVLIEYYEKIGEITNAEDYLYVIAPSLLYTEMDGEVDPVELLVFSSEMQGVDDYAIRLGDLGQDNPKLYAAGDTFDEVAKYGDYRYIPCDHMDLDIEVVSNSKTLMHHLWTIVNFEMDMELDVKFSDDKIYGISKEEMKKRKNRIKDIEKGYQEVEKIQDLLDREKYKLPKSTLVRSFEYVFDHEIESMNFLKFMPNLEILFLQNVDCNDWNAIASLKHLKTLTIKQDESASIDLNAISKIKSLKNLTIQYGIVENEEDLSDLYQLTHLTICDTDLSDISFLFDLKNIQELDLSRNELSDLDGIGKLKNLKSLIANENEISDISDIKNCHNLKVLRLAQNEITNISSLTNLSLLSADLKNNDIRDIKALKSCTLISYLNLSHNPIKDISIIQNMHRLDHLVLENTHITSIDALSSCQELSQLIVADTDIQDIKALSSCKKLKILNLNTTKVHDIQPLKDLQLEKIDLRNVILQSIETLNAKRVYFPWYSDKDYTYHWTSYETFINEEALSQLTRYYRFISLFPRGLLQDIVKYDNDKKQTVLNRKDDINRHPNISQEAILVYEDFYYWSLDLRKDQNTRIGEVKEWYVDGTLKEITYYTSEDGDDFTYKAYDQQGKLSQEGEFKKGLRVFLNLYTDLDFVASPKGTVRAEITYFSPNQYFLDTRYYDEAGNVISYTRNNDEQFEDYEYALASAYAAIVRDHFDIAKRRLDAIKKPTDNELMLNFYVFMEVTLKYHLASELNANEVAQFIEAASLLEKDYPLVLFETVKDQVLIGILRNSIQ